MKEIDKLKKLLVALGDKPSQEDIVKFLQGVTFLLLKIEQANEDKITEVKKLEGPKGDSPTEQELLDLIKPLIPSPVPGEKGADGRTPIFIGKKLPKNPQKGDLWYQD